MKNLHKIQIEEIPARYRAFADFWNIQSEGRTKYIWSISAQKMKVSTSSSWVNTKVLTEESTSYYLRNLGYYSTNPYALPPNLTIVP